MTSCSTSTESRSRRRADGPDRGSGRMVPTGGIRRGRRVASDASDGPGRPPGLAHSLAASGCAAPQHHTSTRRGRAPGEQGRRVEAPVMRQASALSPSAQAAGQLAAAAEELHRCMPPPDTMRPSPARLARLPRPDRRTPHGAPVGGGDSPSAGLSASMRSTVSLRGSRSRSTPPIQASCSPRNTRAPSGRAFLPTSAHGTAE